MNNMLTTTWMLFPIWYAGTTCYFASCSSNEPRNVLAWFELISKKYIVYWFPTRESCIRGKEVKWWWIRVLLKTNELRALNIKKTYPAQTTTDADYANDLALFPNTPAQAKFLLHSLEKAAESYSPFVKAKSMWWKQEREISTISGKPLKLVD